MKTKSIKKVHASFFERSIGWIFIVSALTLFAGQQTCQHRRAHQNQAGAPDDYFANQAHQKSLHPFSATGNAPFSERGS